MTEGYTGNRGSPAMRLGHQPMGPDRQATEGPTASDAICWRQLQPKWLDGQPTFLDPVTALNQPLVGRMLKCLSRGSMGQEVSPHFQRFQSDELAGAPTGPGLYAWYGVIRSGCPDWRLEIRDGVDEGERNSRRLLRDHTARHVGPTLSISAEGGFSTQWSGELTDCSNRELQEILSPADPAGLEQVGAQDGELQRPAPKLQATLSNEAMRRLLFHALECATPVLSAPLYIGVAVDLRVRLEQHMKMLYKLQDAIRADPSRLAKISSNPRVQREFAVRAITRGFHASTVEVWAVDFSQLQASLTNGSELTTSQLRTIAEACEWLLNRWHRPPLGRR